MSQPSRKELTRERIVTAAARAIRRGGYAGVGVADIMKEAGLTHGGFYAHFDSRDAMLSAAMEQAGRESSARLARRMAGRRADGDSPLRAWVETYLSDTHLPRLEEGCPIAALASEMPRQSPDVRGVAARRVSTMIEAIQQVLPASAGSHAAAAIVSTLVGALQLARTLGDNAEGRAVLAAARRSVLDQYDHEGQDNKPPLPH